MAKIKLSSGFTLCPEGTYVFRIYQVDYDESFGKLVIYLVNAQGITVQERYSLLTNDGRTNDKALNAFSYFAKTALNEFTREDIDPADLVNHYIKAEVTHTVQPSRDDPSKTVTFVNLGDKAPATGFDTPAVESALTLGTPATTKPVTAPESFKPTSSLASLLD